MLIHYTCKTKHRREEKTKKSSLPDLSYRHQDGRRKENTFINLLALSQGTMLIFHLHSVPPGNTPEQS